MLQNVKRMGRKVRIAKKIHVKIPPPTFRAKYAGTSALREKRRILEKLSLPAASAGRGPFLIEGYWQRKP